MPCNQNTPAKSYDRIGMIIYGLALWAFAFVMLYLRHRADAVAEKYRFAPLKGRPIIPFILVVIGAAAIEAGVRGA